MSPRRPAAALVINFLTLFVLLSGTALALQANTVRSRNIVNRSVTAEDLGHRAVAAPKLAHRAVAEAKLVAGAVSGAKLARGSVTGAKVLDASLTGADVSASVGTRELAGGAVTTTKIGSNAVTGAKVADGSLGGADLLANSIGPQLANGSVTSAKVLDNSLTNVDINESALGPPLVRNVTINSAAVSTGTSDRHVTANCPGGKILIGGGSDIVLGQDPPGSAILHQSSPSTAGRHRELAGLGDSDQRRRLDAAGVRHLLLMTVAPDNPSRRRSPRPGRPTPALVVSLVALCVAVCGNAYAIRANVVGSAQIVDGQVRAADIARRAARGGTIADGAVTRPKLASSGVGRSALGANSIDGAKVADGSLTGEDFADGSIGSIDLANISVHTQALANGSVNASKVANDTLVGADLADGSLTTADLFNNTIGSSEVANNSMTQGQVDGSTIGSPVLRNVRRKVASSEFGNNTVKVATATCPAGQQVIAGGGYIPEADSLDVGLTKSYPLSTTQWRAIGAEYFPESAAWSVHAVAICANV